MKNIKSNKLWKDVGIIQEKYEKTFQRPPSFDKSDLAKSSDADNSHHNTSHHKSKNRIKTQSPNKKDQQIDSPFKLQSQIDCYLNSVPQQDDLFGSVMTFRQAKSKQQKKMLKSSQMEIFDQIFTKKQSKTKNKASKLFIQALGKKIQQLYEFQYQFEKDIKLCLSQYRNQLRKNDRKVRQSLLRFTKQIFEKNNEIAYLKAENNDIRAQLLQSYEFIEQLQKMNEKTLNAEKSRIDQELTKKTFEKSIRLNTEQSSKSPYLNIPIQQDQTVQRSRVRPSKSLLRRLYSLTQTKPAQSIEKVIKIDSNDRDYFQASSQSKRIQSGSIKKKNSVKQPQLPETYQSSKLLQSKKYLQGQIKYSNQQVKQSDKRQKFKKFIAERQNKRNQIKTKMNKTKQVSKNQENYENRQANMFRQSNLSRLSIPLIIKKQSVSSNPELAEQFMKKNQDLAKTMTIEHQKKLFNNNTYGVFKKTRY